MSEIITGVLELLSQLLDIGGEHPEVLIATMVLIAGAALTCVLFCITVVIAIPFVILRGLFGLIRWLYEIRHPELYYGREEYEEDPDEQPAKTKRKPKKLTEEPQSELDPVLPHWLNQKGGRLL